MTLFEAIRIYVGIDLEAASAAEAQRRASQASVMVSPDSTADEVAMTVFEERVEQHLIQPTFIIDYPATMCPLTKRHRRNPNLAERFELYIQGMEFANAYTELTDPAEQRRHFEAQAQQRLLGNEVAHVPDWDCVESLAYGMPPTGGLLPASTASFAADWGKPHPGRHPPPRCAAPEPVRAACSLQVGALLGPTCSGRGTSATSSRSTQGCEPPRRACRGRDVLLRTARSRHVLLCHVRRVLQGLPPV